MAPYLAMVGEFRVHYAGFFDPGFGMAEAGVPDRAACLRCAATKRRLCWSTVRSSGDLVYEKMTEHPSSFMVRDRIELSGPRAKAVKTL